MKMLAETIFEIIFSPIGYFYLKHMGKEQIGKEYIDLYCIELKDMSKEKDNEQNLNENLNNNAENNENNNNLE